jgi:hypothetical protein
MQANGCERRGEFHLVDVHGLKPQLRGSFHQHTGPVLVLIAPLGNLTVLNTWIPLHD